MFKIATLILLQIAISYCIVSHRETKLDMRPTNWLSDYPISSTGPLKGMLMGLWWMEIQKHQHNYDYKKINTLAKRISFLNPYAPKVWEYLAFNIAINISAEMRYENNKQFEWFVKGMDILEKGKDLNPKSSVLYFAQGYNVYFKLKSSPYLYDKFKGYLGAEPSKYTLDKLEQASKYGKLLFINECFRAQVNFQLGYSERSDEIFNQLLIEYPDRKNIILGMKQELRGHER